MKTFAQTLIAFLLVSIVIAPGFSQDTGKAEKKNKTEGLRKIAGHSRHDRDYDIDDEELEANIEKAVEKAIKSVEVALSKMDLHGKSVDIDLRGLESLKSLRSLESLESLESLKGLENLEIRIPDIDINIPDIDIDMDIDIDIDDDHDHGHRWKVHKRHKSDDKSDKEKTKGLKKIN